MERHFLVTLVLLNSNLQLLCVTLEQARLDGRTPFTEPVMEPDYSLNSDGSTGYRECFSPPVKPIYSAAGGNLSKLSQLDTLGPVSEYADTSPSGLAGYSPNHLNRPSQMQPLYMGY